MAPFGLPWSTFAAFLVLGATIVLAVVWAWLDGRRDRKDER
jgi:hypothetical protein